VCTIQARNAERPTHVVVCSIAKSFYPLYVCRRKAKREGLFSLNPAALALGAVPYCGMLSVVLVIW
jgi:hypothetical protein